MADLEAELARFEAEVAAVRPAAPPTLPPPNMPPPLMPPPRFPPPGGPMQPHGLPPRVMMPQHGPPPMHGPPPGMMGPPMGGPMGGPMGPPPPMMQPPMMQPPVMQPPMMQPPQQPYGGPGPGPSMYGGGGPSIYAAPPVISEPPVEPPSAAASGAGVAGGAPGQQQAKKPGETKVAIVRQAAGAKWVDPTLAEWPENDFRIFVGNLGNEVTDAHLTAAFNKYSSFTKAKVVRSSHNNKTKGYGFVSLGDIQEGARCLREMQGKYIGNRPIQVKRSNWDERNVVDKRTGKAKKRQIVVKDKPEAKRSKPAGGGGILHR